MTLRTLQSLALLAITFAHHYAGILCHPRQLGWRGREGGEAMAVVIRGMGRGLRRRP